MASNPENGPPEHGVQAIREGLPELLPVEHRIPAGGSWNIKISTPIKFYTATAEDTRHLQVLANARFVAWHYLLFDEKDEPFGSAKVSDDGSLLSFSRGPSTQATVDTLGRFEAEGFEVRYLKISGISLLALWFHSEEAGKQDFVVPMAPTAVLETRRYEVPEFLQACQEAAERRGGVAP